MPHPISRHPRLHFRTPRCAHRTSARAAHGLSTRSLRALLGLLATLFASATSAGTFTIQGTVTGEGDGQPTGSRLVLIYDQNDQFVQSSGSQPDGSYAINDLAEGTYWLRTGNLDRTDLHLDETHTGALCPFGECPSPAAAELIELTASTPVATVDFQLQLGGTIAGTVTDTNSGATLGSAWVSLRNDDGETIESERMISGSYTFYAFPPGTYHAAAFVPLSDYIPEAWDDIVCHANTCDEGATTEIVVTAGSTVPIDFALELGGSVSGVFVTDENTPNPGTPISGQVAIFTDQGDFLLNTNAQGGTYRIGQLPTGTYFARGTNSSGYYNEIYEDVLWGNGHSAEVTDGTPIQVIAGQETAHIDFRLPSGASISGRVTDALTGDFLPNFFVYAIRVDDPAAPVSASSVEALQSLIGEPGPTEVPLPRADRPSDVTGTPLQSPDARTLERGLDGTYQLIPLDAGTYEIEARSQDDSYLPATWPQLITLEVNDAVTGIDFALVPTAQIRGTVTDDDGNPIAGAYVGWRNLDPDDTSFGGAYTAADGTYAITGLASHEDLVMIAGAPGHVPELHPNLICHGFLPNCDTASATVIAVGPADEVTGIDFQLGPAVTLAVEVTRVADGTPIENAGVRVFDSNGLSITSRGTDASGHAVFDTLPPGGTYHVATSFVIGYYFELWQNRPFSYYTDFSQPIPEVLAGAPIDFSGGETTISIAIDLDDETTAPALSAEVLTQFGGSGSIATVEGFLDCNETGGVVCTTLGYPTGSTTTLIATPAPGSTFVGFGGDDDCLDGELTLDGDRHCTATFAGEPPLFADGWESGDLAAWSGSSP